MKIDSNNLVRSQFNQMQILCLEKKISWDGEVAVFGRFKMLKYTRYRVVRVDETFDPKRYSVYFSSAPRIPSCFMQRRHHQSTSIRLRHDWLQICWCQFLGHPRSEKKTTVAGHSRKALRAEPTGNGRHCSRPSSFWEKSVNYSHSKIDRARPWNLSIISHELFLILTAELVTKICRFYP